MRRIAVINQKGGVGKTTTAANLGAALARLGRRVLVCDLDPQCNLTVHLDVDPAGEAPTLYELLRGEASLEQVVRAARSPGLWLLPSSVDLAGAELELVNVVGREVLLRDAFEADARAHGQPRWDVVLCDCPPSLGLLSLNALVLCDEVFVPVQAEFFALQGLSKLLEITGLVQRRLNPQLRVTGLISCRHDTSTNLGRQVMEDIRSHFGEVLFRSVIRRNVKLAEANVKLAEAPSHGRTIFEYDPECRGAADYLALALNPDSGDASVPGLLKPEVIAESALVERDLADYDCIFLCNVAQFTSSEARLLESVLKRGGEQFAGRRALARPHRRRQAT